MEIWKCLGRKYSATAVWQEIRLKNEKKDWHRVLWASPSIPKHVLITWMTILNRLPTMDRLEAWGMEVVALCRLCHTGRESRDHLFFCCSYSMSIWKEVLKLCGLGRTIGSWSEELRWVSIKLKRKALISIVLRIAWKAVIYHIWRERNRRIYGEIPESATKLIHFVKDAVKFKVGSFVNIADDSINNSLCRNWRIFVPV